MHNSARIALCDSKERRGGGACKLYSEKLAGEGYLSSRTPLRRGHGDSWAGWT